MARRSDHHTSMLRKTWMDDIDMSFPTGQEGRKEGRDGRCISARWDLFKDLKSKQKILNKDSDDFFLF